MYIYIYIYHDFIIIIIIVIIIINIILEIGEKHDKHGLLSPHSTPRGHGQETAAEGA